MSFSVIFWKLRQDPSSHHQHPNVFGQAIKSLFQYLSYWGIIFKRQFEPEHWLLNFNWHVPSTPLAGRWWNCGDWWHIKGKPNIKCASMTPRTASLFLAIDFLCFWNYSGMTERHSLKKKRKKKKSHQSLKWDLGLRSDDFKHVIHIIFRLFLCYMPLQPYWTAVTVQCCYMDLFGGVNKGMRVVAWSSHYFFLPIFIWSWLQNQIFGHAAWIGGDASLRKYLQGWNFCI